MAGLQDIMQALGQGGQPQGNLGRVSLDYLGGSEELQRQLQSLSPEMQQMLFPLGLQQGLGARPLQSGVSLQQGLRGRNQGGG
jgi:hypothetical protein